MLARRKKKVWCCEVKCEQHVCLLGQLPAKAVSRRLCTILYKRLNAQMKLCQSKKLQAAQCRPFNHHSKT